jgi:phosphatidylserine/phosphatidylglycerophosphate/cardiolipin synthase-like enzyme
METIIGKQFPVKVIPLIDSSEKTIKIVVFDWRWYPQDPANPVQLFNQSIVRAVRRGVKVQAIANNDEIVRTLKACGVSAKRLTAQNLLHCKLMIIDDKIAIIGSHNYTQSAFTMNFELSVIVDIESQNLSFDNFFNNLFNDY